MNTFLILGFMLATSRYSIEPLSPTSNIVKSYSPNIILAVCLIINAFLAYTFFVKKEKKTNFRINVILTLLTIVWFLTLVVGYVVIGTIIFPLIVICLIVGIYFIVYKTSKKLAIIFSAMTFVVLMIVMISSFEENYCWDKATQADQSGLKTVIATKEDAAALKGFHVKPGSEIGLGFRTNILCRNTFNPTEALKEKYFFINQNAKPVEQSQIKPTQNPPVEITRSVKVGELRLGGSSYRDPDDIFTILYPNDFTLDTSDAKHPRIYKKGATQRDQTEMYDGVIVVLETVDLQDQALEQLVDIRIKNSVDNGIVEVTQSKQTTILNNYPGFTYKVRGLGESTYLAIQKNPSSSHAVIVTYAVHDPEQKNFQNEVDAILSTLELLK